MKRQMQDFLRYFISIEDGTNKDIPNHKIEKIYFNPEFHKAFVKAQYIKKNDRTFRGYPFVIDYEEDADYWGMDCSLIENNDFLNEVEDPIMREAIRKNLESMKLWKEEIESEFKKPYITD